MPLPLTVTCFSKIQISFTFLVPAHLVSPGQRAVKQVCVCVHRWLMPSFYPLPYASQHRHSLNLVFPLSTEWLLKEGLMASLIQQLCSSQRFCQTSDINTYPTDLCQICRVGRTVAVDEWSEGSFFDPPRDVAVATNFVGRMHRIQFQPHTWVSEFCCQSADGWHTREMGFPVWAMFTTWQLAYREVVSVVVGHRLN